MTLDLKDLKFDSFGLTKSSSIKVTHIPTGLFAVCAEFKSKEQNKMQAIEDLEAMFKYKNDNGL